MNDLPLKTTDPTEPLSNYRLYDKINERLLWSEQYAVRSITKEFSTRRLVSGDLLYSFYVDNRYQQRHQSNVMLISHTIPDGFFIVNQALALRNAYRIQFNPIGRYYVYAPNVEDVWYVNFIFENETDAFLFENQVETNNK